MNVSNERYLILSGKFSTSWVFEEVALQYTFQKCGVVNRALLG